MITPLVHQRRGLIIQGYDVGFTEQQEIITISVLLLCLLEQELEHFVSSLGWGMFLSCATICFFTRPNATVTQNQVYTIHAN